MPHIEAGLALVRMAVDDLQDAAGYVCTKRDFECANGDDEDEEEEEEKKKKEKDEEDEDEDEDDEDDGEIQTVSRQAGKIEQDIAGWKRTTQPAELSRRVGESSTAEAGQPARAG
jgi:hypothetical protein